MMVTGSEGSLHYFTSRFVSGHPVMEESMSTAESSDLVAAAAAADRSPVSIHRDSPPAPAVTAVGRFRYDVPKRSWWCSSELLRMRGVAAPGDNRPVQTERILAAIHPDDRAEVEVRVREAIEAGRPFTQQHRILDTTESVRHVVTVGQPLVESERVTGVDGYVVDVTDAVERQVNDEVWDRASKVIENRATIERAKGALMAAHGLDADAAFELLRLWSSTRNVKLRDVARQVIDDL
jgi:hypothetical protein